MGVPAFFRWLSRKYPAIVVHCVEHKVRVLIKDDIPASIHDVKIPIDTSQPNPNEIEFDNLYLDMNGIIHPCCHPEDKSAPKNEDEMMIAIFEYIDRIFSIVRPRKLLYMAIDGVAPRAKMNQQRSRRFRAAKETVEKSDEIKRLRVEMFSKGYYLPSQKPVEEKFDSNCITPGTPFMFRLAECLRFYIHERLNSDPGWSSIKVILSDANVPGEGEHKIMDYIRRQRAQPDHDPNTNHCLCGADADLIMLGLATHEPHFTIIREEFKPNKPKPCELCGQFGHETSECVGLPKDKCGEFDELTTPLGVEQEFIFIRLNVLREYLERELRMDGLPFVYDFERALDDWVFMCFFVGNDFLPHLPSLQIREGAIDRLVKLYKRAVYKTGGYLTNSGVVNLSRVQLIMSDLGKMEDEIFKNRRNSDLEFRKRDKERKKRMKRDIIKPAWMLGGQYAPQALGAAVPTIQKPRQTAADLRMQQKAYFSYASGRNLEQQQVADTLKSMLVNGEPGAGAAATDMQDTRGTKRKHEADDEDDEPADDIKLWEDGFKDRYYKKKFDSESDDLAFRYVVAYHYVLGLCWVLRYYYQGCPSWKWYFPYHYAPFASDFINISDIPNEFEKHTQPFKPLEQLMGVFPSASRQFLPPTWQRLMTDSDSSIIDFYPTDFKIDLNGKKFAWQGVALLPFVDETRLKAALADVYSDLTQEEIKRNIRGNDRLFVNHRHAAFNFLEGLYEGGGINQRVRIDPSLSEGMAGNVWCDDFVVLFGEVVRSPLPQLKDLNDNRVISVQFEDLRFEEDFIFPAKMLSGAKLLDRVLKPEDFERKFPGQQYRPQLGFTKNSGYRPSNPNSALRMIRSNLGGAQQMMSQLLFNQRMGEMGQQQQQQQQQYPGRTDYWQQNHQDSTRWNQGCRIPPPSSEQWQRNSHGYGYASHGNTGGYSSSAHDRSVWRQPVASSSYSSSSYGGRQPQIESYSTNSGNLAFSQQSDNRRQQYPLPPNYQSSTSSLSYRRY